MENKKRALGRGLEQLFNNENLDLDSIEKRIYETSSKEEIEEINISDLRPNPYQPRTVFNEEALLELASSIKSHGVFQPIIVKKSIKGFEIVAGERRTRAAKIAGLTTIPAIVKDFSDDQMMEIGLLENLQRENLNPIEEANAYHMMIERLHLTQDELAHKVGKSRSHVTNVVGILRLPGEVQNMISNKQLTMGHAKVLSKLESSDQIIEMARNIVLNQIPVREVENMSIDKNKKIKVNRAKEPNRYKFAEELCREKLDTKVRIHNKKIEISFINDSDLNRILEILDIGE